MDEVTHLASFNHQISNVSMTGGPGTEQLLIVVQDSCAMRSQCDAPS